MVVLVSMLFAKHFGFKQAREEFHIQELVSKAGVITFTVGIFAKGSQVL